MNRSTIRSRPHRLRGAGLLAAGLLATGAGGAVLRVDDDNLTGLRDGSALHPYPSIQEALDAAVSGDTVAVAAGSYTNIVIDDKAVELLGGHAGGSPADYAGGPGGDFDARDPDANPSFIRGTESFDAVLLVRTGASGTTVDGFRITGGHHGILFDSAVTWPQISDVTISRSRIENNGVTNSYTHSGGGINISAGDLGVRIVGNVIRGNCAGRGAGMAGSGSGPIMVVSNVVENNTGYGDHGGGIYLFGTHTISHNLIQSNRTGVGTGYGGWGAGVFASYSTRPSLSPSV